jgi:hypothetical protein
MSPSDKSGFSVASNSAACSRFVRSVLIGSCVICAITTCAKNSLVAESIVHSRGRSITDWESAR